MRLPALVGLLPVLVLSAACSAPPNAEQRGASSASVTGGSCSASRDEILASTSPARQAAIQRGFAWLDAGVPYSQSKSYGGYRTDCSGFVSMCWDLGTSPDTAALYATGTYDADLASWDDLLPADALVHRSGGSGHVVLFLGWEPDRAGVCVLEQASTASDMQFRVRSVASLRSGGFKPIRANALAGDTGTSDGTTAVAADPATGGTATDAPAAGTCVPFAPLDVCNEAKLTRGIECGTVLDNCGNDVDCDAVPSFACKAPNRCSEAQKCVKPVKTPATTTEPPATTTTEPPAPSGSVPPVGDVGDVGGVGSDSPASADESTSAKGAGSTASSKRHAAPVSSSGCSAAASTRSGSDGSGALLLALAMAASMGRRRLTRALRRAAS